VKAIQSHFKFRKISAAELVQQRSISSGMQWQRLVTLLHMTLNSQGNREFYWSRNEKLKKEETTSRWN